MKKIFPLLLFYPFLSYGVELETSAYVVKIESTCEEGEVSCDQYTYTGTNKRSGKSITLQGSSWHRLCSDGVTPCRFLGYQFHNGDITYYIHDSGLLEVIENGEKVLLRQQGEWK